LETLAVGFFDGVHLGHQKILHGASAVLTFRNHPLSVLAPERAPHLIMTPEERVAAIKACGVAEVTLLDFTRELAEMPAGEFVEFFLNKRRGRRFPFAVRCGENWRFGKGGIGDAAFVRNAGIEAVVVPYVEYKGERISSSRIRACLERGEIEDANAMLGRRYQVTGIREQGKGLGEKLGYPTINLKLSTINPQPLTLPRGVYEVVMNGERGLANYGVAPTFGEKSWSEPILEVHLLSDEAARRRFPSDLAAVEFVRFLRPERKFASVEELKRQIAADFATITP